MQDKKKKALVVDDSSVMRKLLSEVLRSMGFDYIEEACDGEEAIECITDFDFDLVLMDWNMPLKSGFDALVEIRESGNEVPVIMVTTEAEKSRVLDALKAGADNYVIKPFSPETINNKIQTTLSTRKKQPK